MTQSAIYNMVRCYTPTTGAGTLTLGSALPSFLTFAGAGVSNGATVSYVIEDGIQRECGQGVYNSAGPVLTRATIYSSTNAGAAINLSGSGQVYIDVLASDFVQLGTANAWSALQTFTSGVAITGSNAGNAFTATISGAPLNIVLTNYGTLNQAYPSYYAYAAGGTSSLPSAVLAGDALAGFYGYGWTSAGAWSVTNVGMEFVAAENWTATANGGLYWFYASPNGLAANSIVGTLTGSGVLTIGVQNSLGTISGGSGYISGTYTNVPLTTVSGAGSNAKATIVVTSGSVTSVTITSSGGAPSGGVAYTGGSVLSAANTNLGGSGSGFQVVVANITALGGALGNGATGQLALISQYGGGAISIENASGTGSGNYTLALPQSPGASGQYLQSNGNGNYLTWQSPALGNVNVIRNGTLDVWQRGTSFTTSGAYTADGWYVQSTGASVAVGRAAGRLLTQYALILTGATSVTDVQVKQPIEGAMASKMSSQTVTFQAQVYNNTGSTITPTLTVKHPTTTDTYSSSVTDVSAVAMQSCANGVWTQIAYTWNASASSNLGMEIVLDFGNNFSTNGKLVYLTEVDLRTSPGVSTGLNANPPPPELRPIATELILCQRYLFQPNFMAIGVAASTQVFSNPVVWPVQMYATPTLSNATFTPSTGSAGVVAMNTQNNQSGFIYNSSNNWTIGVLVQLTASLSAEIAP